MNNLIHETRIVLKLVRANSLKADYGKFQFMILDNQHGSTLKQKINLTEIEEGDKVVLPGKSEVIKWY